MYWYKKKNKKKLLAVAAAAILAIPISITPAVAAESGGTSGQVTSPTYPNRAPDGLTYLSQSIDRGEDGRFELTLVWSKPANYQEYVDYAIFERVKDHGASDYSKPSFVGLASQNQLSPAQRAFDVFYADKSNSDAVKASMHNYILAGLKVGTDYSFEVRGITRNGHEVPLGQSYHISMSTPAEVTRQFVVNKDGYKGISGAVSAADGGAKQYTEVLQAAIDDAASYAAESGKPAEVVIPKGVELHSGAIYLKSNVTFRIEGTLRESLDLSLITPSSTKFTPTNSEKFLPLINITGSSKERLQNVRIVGTGTIDGQGWQYRSDAPDVEYADQLGLAQSKEATVNTVSENGLLSKKIYESCVDAGGPTGDNNCYKKRSQLIEGSQVDNMYIGGGLRIENPANTIIGFKYISNYVVNGIVLQSFNSNNGDSINVSRFTGFTALNNIVNSGDDNIVMNAGNEREAPVGSAWVFDNYLGRGHGGVAFGSGTSSWIDNVLIEDDVFDGTSDGIRAKSKPGSGGGVRFVTVRDLAMKDLTNRVEGKVDPLVVGYQMDGAAFIFTTHYPGDYNSVAWPVYHNWSIENVSVDGTQTAGILIDGLHEQNKLDAAGIPFLPSNHINFKDVRFKNAGIPRIDYLTDSSFDNVTFRDPQGKLITNPWLNVQGLEHVMVNGETLPSSGLKFKATPNRGAYTGSPEGLRFVSDGSFDRFYVESLPEDLRTRVGAILVDGVPLADENYPSFQSKINGGAVVPGSDQAVRIEPEYDFNVHTVFTFSPEFLDKLPKGEHTFTFVFSNGTASTTINSEGNIDQGK